MPCGNGKEGAMEDIIWNCMQGVEQLLNSPLPQEIVDEQIEYLEETIKEMERIEDLCHVL